MSGQMRLVHLGILFSTDIVGCRPNSNPVLYDVLYHVGRVQVAERLWENVNRLIK